MKNLIKYLRSLSMLFVLLTIMACKSDSIEEEIPIATGNSKTYAIHSFETLEPIGSVSFIENTNNTVSIKLILSDTQKEILYDAQIRKNTSIEGGDIVLNLEPVNGDDGESFTVVEVFEDGSPINYEELLNFDGHINIQPVTNAESIVFAQGDIGQNELTNQSLIYSLNIDMPFQDAGTATFTKRANNEVLVTIQLNETSLPNNLRDENLTISAFINSSPVYKEDNISLTFDFIDPKTGIGKTNILKWDDNSPFLFESLSSFNGSINILYEKDENGLTTSSIIQGYMGEYAVTGRSLTYKLDDFISGKGGVATFYELFDGTTLAFIDTRSIEGEGWYQPYLDLGGANADGSLISNNRRVFTFNNILPFPERDGISRTHMVTLNDGNPIRYKDISSLLGLVYLKNLSSNTSHPILKAYGFIGIYLNSDGVPTEHYQISDYDLSFEFYNAAPYNSSDWNGTRINPTLTLERGKSYLFKNISVSHPFFIKTIPGTTDANLYNEGVINNGAVATNILIPSFLIFSVPMDAPDTLYYNSQFHPEAAGVFSIIDPI